MFLQQISHLILIKMSGKNLNYIPQPMHEETVGDDVTEGSSQIAFHDTHISIPGVDTINSEKINEKFRVFGTDLRVKSPYRMGKLITFFYINGEPLFVIGPQCKTH
jgi:hypothetical protein